MTTWSLAEVKQSHIFTIETDCSKACDKRLAPAITDCKQPNTSALVVCDMTTDIIVSTAVRQ